MIVVRYEKDAKGQWNNFVRESATGHFFFDRDYMDYHSDRFEDHSLMFFEGNKLLALLPANEANDRLYTHQGLTFGGVLLSAKVYTADTLLIFKELLAYLKGEGISELVYKAMPWIYNTGTREESLYALSSVGAVLTRRDVSSVIDMRADYSYRTNMKRNLKKAAAAGLSYSVVDDASRLWEIVIDVLDTKHSSEPTHSLEEMHLLMSRFPENIEVYEVAMGQDVLGGLVAFKTKSVIHTQYLAVNEAGRQVGALNYLIDQLIMDSKGNYSYFSLGISTENQGKHLNEGLIYQKEGFGARANVHDFYSIAIARDD